MKKHCAFISIVLVLLLSLAGCAGQTPPNNDTEIQTQPESRAAQQAPVLPDTDGTSSFLAGEESKSPVSSTASEPEQSSIPSQCSEEVSVPKQEETKPPVSQQPQPTTPSASQQEQKPDPPESSKPPASESEAPPIPTDPESTPAFDVTPYVQSAKEYGAGIGLTLDSTATACWDDPLTANARCRYLERDLRDRLDWYKVSGINAFWVWAEQTGDGEYLIYIGYA